jgi:hypothetical protein
MHGKWGGGRNVCVPKSQTRPRYVDISNIANEKPLNIKKKRVVDYFQIQFQRSF